MVCSLLDGHIFIHVAHRISDRLLSVHEALLAKLNFPWTEQHDRLLQWQLGNITFSCGATLSDVSALSWDQNE